MNTYVIPFDQPEDINVEEFCRLIEKHNIDIGKRIAESTYLIGGTKENLIEFCREVDGPGQSFPIDEFSEWIQDYRIV